MLRDANALNPLEDHAPLRKLGFHEVHIPCFDIRPAVIRLMERAPQGSRLTIEVLEGLFSKEEAAEAMQEAALARHRAGIPGGVPALILCN
jgi:hypothetical protein